MRHFYNEKNYLRQFDHPHIVKVYEYSDATEINLPIYLYNRLNKCSDSQKIENHLAIQNLLDNIDKIETLGVDNLTMLYPRAIRIAACSILVMEYAEHLNLFHYIKKKQLSEVTAIWVSNQLIDALSYMNR